MNLIKTSLLNSIAVGIRVLTSLGLNKLLAVYVGPSGYAVIGQFQNFVTMLTTVASGAVNAGVIKYTAEYFDDEARQIAVWKTAGTVALTGSITLGLLIAILHKPLAVWILKDKAIASVFIFLGAGLVFFTFNALLLAILNGKKEIKRYVTVNIAGSLISLIITGTLSVFWGLYGTLVALAINQSIVFCVTLSLCWRSAWFHLRYLIGRLDPIALRSLGKYTLMALTSAACVPISQILIRSHLGASFGWQAAGHWEALMRISGLYLMVVTTPLAVYYLPRLSEIRDNAQLRHEIMSGYRVILPVAAAGALAIYVLRDWLVVTLFSAEFAPMRFLFAWQMMGDIMKIGSWLVAYVMLGRAMTKTFIMTEILFSASWVGLVFLFTGFHGVQGAQIAYCANYTAYWTVMGIIIYRKIQ